MAINTTSTIVKTNRDKLWKLSQKSIYSIAIFALLLVATAFECHVHRSIDQISTLPKTARFYEKLIRDKIEQTNTLQNQYLKVSSLLNDFHTFINNTKKLAFNGELDFARDPILSFKALAKLYKIEEALEHLNITGVEKSEWQPEEGTVKTRTKGCEDCFAVTNHDLKESSLALLRLQRFYNLITEDIISGFIVLPNRQTDTNVRFNNCTIERYKIKCQPVLDYEDCLTIGKTAYENEHYRQSITWLQNSIKLYTESKKDLLSKDIDFLCNTLEYLAFASYKNNQVKYASQITKIWLELEPYNSKAQKNLAFYTYLADNQNASDVKFRKGDLSKSKKIKTYAYKNQKKFKRVFNDYVSGVKKLKTIITSDTIIKMCTTSYSLQQAKRNDTYCFRQNLIVVTDKKISVGGFKIEILNKDPAVMRIHDFITDLEAKSIMSSSYPSLSSSTTYKDGVPQVRDDVRVGKTAWLKNEEYQDIDIVEDRIARFLGSELSSSGPFQVVNYGLGGFFKPHDDHSRGGLDYSQIDFDGNATHVHYRAATFLIYLEETSIGGSTGFIHLNFTAEVIRKSALIWYNIKRDGTSEDRVTHMSCPVLLGTKWIGTKWIEERANIFKRPCDLKGRKTLDLFDKYPK